MNNTFRELNHDLLKLCCDKASLSIDYPEVKKMPINFDKVYDIDSACRELRPSTTIP